VTTHATVRDMTYEAPVGGGEVEAYLVESVGRPASGGALFLQWFDPEAEDGNRTQFVSEAEQLASEGMVSLLPQQAFPWSSDPTDSQSDVERIEAEVARLRAGLDVLEGAGASRLAIVGHDFGAMHAILLMTADRRPGAAVLIAPTPRWADWSLRFWPISEDRIDYLRALRPFDPIEQIGSLAPASLLLQFADDDFFIAGMTANELFRAASEPKDLKRYPTDHAMRDPQARADRIAFVRESLTGPR
jgi:dienelactone hydrolase